eukprot:2373442-Rhodomonas_salina.1
MGGSSTREEAARVRKRPSSRRVWFPHSVPDAAYAYPDRCEVGPVEPEQSDVRVMTRAAS